jgi:hypothetical protein
MNTYLDPVSHVRVLQNQDLARQAARVRLIKTATQPSPAVTPRPVGRIRVGLRHAVASLIALASIG